MGAAASSVVEKLKDVPVATDGAGIAGQSAALASARLWMNTLLIDRFGSLGGNIGACDDCGREYLWRGRCDSARRPTGIPKKFVERLETLRGTPSHCYADESSIVAYLGFKMAEKAGAELLLAA